MLNLNNDWQPLFEQERAKPYLQKIDLFLAREYKTKNIYPPAPNIFEALKRTPKKDVKVVILGQDPYHGPGQAHGLAFSVNPQCPIPPSLQNIYKELEREYGQPVHRTGDLRDWADQGVLLLNPILTVEQGHPLSHGNIGWQTFTNEVLRALDQQEQPIVFILWGSKARQARSILHNPWHLILESPHPSPLSAHRGFFGNNHFRAANDYLTANGQTPIDWIGSSKEENHGTAAAAKLDINE